MGAMAPEKKMSVMQVANLKCQKRVTNVLIFIPRQSSHSGFERTIFSWFMICANASLYNPSPGLF